MHAWTCNHKFPIREFCALCSHLISDPILVWPRCWVGMGIWSVGTGNVSGKIGKNKERVEMVYENVCDVFREPGMCWDGESRYMAPLGCSGNSRLQRQASKLRTHMRDLNIHP